MLLSRLLVELGLKDNLAPGLDKSKKGVKEWAADLRKTGTMFTAAITTPVVGGFVKMIQAASDQNEAISAVGTTYGDAAKIIMDAADDSAQSVGLSKAEYLSAATTLGVFGKMAGATGDDLGNFGTTAIGAAADLASFYNTPVPEALDAIKSGLMGEYEPLRRFGILLNESTVQQKAMEMGIWDGNGALTEQQKVAARNALIMEGLGDAQGDFARTQGGLANQTRILKAQLADTGAEMGKVLLPFALKLVKGLGRMMRWVQRLSDRQKKWIVVLAGVAAAIGPILIGISAMLPAIAALTGPIGLIVLALVGLGIAYKTNLFGFRDAVNATAVAVWNFLKPIIAFGAAMIEAFRSGKGVSDLVTQFPGPLQGAAKGFLLIADAVGDLIARWRSGGFGAMLDLLPAKLNQIKAGFRQLGRTVIGLASAAFGGLVNAIKEINWSSVWDAITDVGAGILGTLGDITSGLVTWMRGQIDAVDWGTVWTKTVEFGEIAINGALKLADKLLQASRDFGAWLKPQLIGAWNGSIDIGIVTIIITGFKIGGATLLSIPIEIIKGINGIDTSGIGEAIGRKIAENPIALIASGIILAGNLYEGFIKGIKKIPAKAWVAPLLALAPIAMVPVGLAFVGLAIKKTGEFMLGFAKGITRGWQVYPLPVIRALPTLAQSAIGYVVSGSRSLVQKGRDLVQGLKDGAEKRWDSAAIWFFGIGPRARRAIPNVSESLLHKGEDLIIGLWDGAQAMWESADGVVGWLGGLGSDAAGYLGDAATAAYDALWQAGFAFFKPVYDGMQWVWDNWIQPLIDKIPGWVPGFGGSDESVAASASARMAQAGLATRSAGGFAVRNTAGLASAAGSRTVTLTVNNNFSGVSAADKEMIADHTVNRISRELRLAGIG